MITENLSTLKIHKLTQEQYDRELASGRIDENALYLTPDEAIDLSGYATLEDLKNKSNLNHSHDDLYYTETEIDEKLSGINTSITNITSGTTVVKKAEYATSAGNAATADTATTADSATNAEHSASSDSATKATQDASGNIITDTYETKTDAQLKYDELVAIKAEKNHVHSWNDLDDKPFGEMPEYILDWSGTAPANYDGTCVSSTSVIVDPNLIQVGETYTLGFNGSTTEAKAESIYMNQVIGFRYVNFDNGYTIEYQIQPSQPDYGNFLVYNYEEWVNNEDLPESMDITFTIAKSTVKQIPIKYIPDELMDEAKSYADSVASTVKDDLLNGAGDAYDTLKELGDLIIENNDAIEALETIASGKAEADHDHAIADVSGLQSALDGKADASHGSHVSFDSTNKPKMDGTAAFGTSTKVARADHVHPTDTSRASQVDLDTHIADTTKHITSTERTNWGAAYTHSQSAHAPSNAQANVIESIKVNGTAQTITSKAVNITVPTDNSQLANGAGYITSSAIANKADKSTTLAGYGITNAYTKSEVDAKTVVDAALSSSSTNPVQNKVVNSAITTATSAITANTNSINAHSTAITNLQTAISEIQEITSADIQALFA